MKYYKTVIEITYYINAISNTVSNGICTDCTYRPEHYSTRAASQTTTLFFFLFVIS